MAPRKKTTEAAAPAPEEDVAMNEAPAEEEEQIGDVLIREDPHNPTALAFQEQRIRMLPGSTENAASFEFKKEDHTLGNALRYIIMKNPDVEFCGYSIPHPSEELMNIRIQTYNMSAEDALRKGLDDLIDLCDIVADKFTDAREEYASNNPAST
ncbi:dna-directed RNA polymerase i and iii 14 kda polypeptide protein [Rutstroemia sp. NJR-2017a WRK4]|nr:dna-directed RNA polymerase i and iii 14 kda polypeptide protein [Rutstroemia sp. NJR-2017a WRK4]